ncbi:MAG: hypothetical protein IJS81_12465 [Selenomonadaceae bacterium]|nr:hypothetical protein [Selenomonadaceae bacterium]MBQ7631003.1 hypothetical protein [Selenomonadaceae bacterium]
MADVVLDKWRKYKKSCGIDELSQATAELDNEYFDNPNLTDEENALIAERQKFVAEHFAFSVDDVDAQILSVKTQAENLAARIDKINREPNSIRELAELEKEPRVSFEFLVENLTELVDNGKRRVNFFESNKDLSTAAMTCHKSWNEDFINFKTNLRGNFEKICAENLIEEEFINKWYEDW